MIRIATENDFNSIMDIWLNENIKAHGFIPKTYWNDFYSEVRETISIFENYVYDDNGIKGFVSVVGNYISGIYIKEEFHLQGIGSLLLNHLKKIKPRLSLEVYVKNINAINFYKKNGFEIKQEKIEDSTKEKEYRMEWCI